MARLNPVNFGLPRDDVLENITLYWLTNTGISLARSYWENKLSYFGPKNFSTPAAVTVFPGEIYQPSRRWPEGGYSKLSYFHEVDKGGHFAAWEESVALRVGAACSVQVAAVGQGSSNVVWRMARLPSFPESPKETADAFHLVIPSMLGGGPSSSSPMMPCE